MTRNLSHLTLAFGLLGNFVSVMRNADDVYKKKSTEGFQSASYVVGLFSAMLWIYCALLKSNVMPLITINIIETLYIDGEFEAICIANSCRVRIDCCPNSVPCKWSYLRGDSWMDLPCVSFKCFCSSFESFATSD
ncbi:SWEET sugar transporter [Cynara cardunculus var. scolymus]|uniref:SWEET sugar transporter n=1 Tax=Cynara cardunculus var. scolymus TaxID=59895 RepID=A0A103YBP7_CYNCS|nr:SWEET sugar transporter [Cynara cardunculus var. scolymus]